MPTPSEPVLEVRSLTKSYRLGRQRSPLRDLLGRHHPDRLTALDGVTFDVGRGEAVAVIGGNGAGKSTLLKVLSRITPPTSGTARITGRVGSLLEVGTGFHPELTGEENVFLNGAILGMRRAEVRRHLTDIVEFAGIERFLDTPVKRYSSGMYVRLAFAVAAHLETDVLLVDEVLAVGDAEFQSRCLGRMQDAAATGRTVVFVSHDHVAVEALCPRAILLDAGRIAFDGPSHEALDAYLRRSQTPGVSGTPGVADLSGRPEGPARVALQALLVTSAEGDPTETTRLGAPLALRVHVKGVDLRRMVVGVRIRNAWGAPVLGLNNRMRPGSGPTEGTLELRFQLDRFPLVPGRYSVDLAVVDAADGRPLDEIHGAITITVSATDVFGTGYVVSDAEGPVLPDFEWEAREVQTSS